MYFLFVLFVCTIQLEAEAKFVKNTLRQPRKKFNEKGGHTMIIGHSLCGAYTNIVGPRAHIQTFGMFV